METPSKYAIGYSIYINMRVCVCVCVYVTRDVLQTHGEGEHGEPGGGGRAEDRRRVRSGRAAHDGHVQERCQTLGHDGPPEF